MKSQNVRRIERSFDGLRDTLFNQIDGVISGEVKCDKANAIARLAGEITKSVGTQLELCRALGGQPRAIKMIDNSKK